VKADDRPLLHFKRLRAEGDVTFGMYARLLRASVPGGWLIVADQADGAGVTFVPDPAHQWDGGSVPVERGGA